jgi:hypothetical protein
VGTTPIVPFAFSVLLFSRPQDEQKRGTSYCCVTHYNQFLVKENVGPTEIWMRLYSQYGELTFSKTQVKVWHKKFQEGREATENTSHQRSPQMSTLRMLQQFRNLLKMIAI